VEGLVEYEWPGNIRELENVIQSAVILADGDCITLNELHDFLRQLTDEKASRRLRLTRRGSNRCCDSQGHPDEQGRFLSAAATRPWPQGSCAFRGRTSTG
jgi:transcriptional regulator of acetoin/glycerol metabolism